MATSHQSSEISYAIPIADVEVEPASGAADAAAPFSEVEQQLVPFGITVTQPPPQRAEALVMATVPMAQVVSQMPTSPTPMGALTPQSQQSLLSLPTPRSHAETIVDAQWILRHRQLR